MKKLLLVLFAIGICFSASPSILTISGSGATDAGGAIIALGDLTVGISSTSVCTNDIYTRTFTNVIQNGTFSITLGQENDLNLNHNQRYWLNYSLNGVPQFYRNNSNDTINCFEWQSPVGQLNSSYIATIVNLNGNWSSDKASYATTALVATIYNFSISDVASNIGNWTNDKSSYWTAAQAATLGNWSGNTSNYWTSAQTATLGNWTGNMSSYATTALLATVGNWTADKSSYATTALMATIGNWTSDKTNYWTSAQTSTLGNWSGNQSLYIGIGNWSGNQSSYATTAYANSLGNFSGNNSTIARIGNCTAGQVVQNITTGGVECVAAGATVETDPIYTAQNGTIARTGTASCADGYVAQNVTSTTTGLTSKCVLAGAGSGNISGFGTVGQWAFFISNGVLASSALTTSNVSEGANLYFTAARLNLNGNWSSDKASYYTITQVNTALTNMNNISTAQVSAMITNTTILRNGGNCSGQFMTGIDPAGVYCGTPAGSGNVSDDGTYGNYAYLISSGLVGARALPVYNNLTLAQVATDIENSTIIRVGNTTWITNNQLKYQNGSSNLTMADISGNIGNYSAAILNNLSVAQVSAMITNSTIPRTNTHNTFTASNNMTQLNITNSGYISGNSSCIKVCMNATICSLIGWGC